MNNERMGVHASRGIGLQTLGVIVLLGVLVSPWSDSHATPPPFAVDFHVISSGGNSLRNSCFHLSGTTGQTAPGYSSNASDSIVSGFLAAAPTAGLDDIFFNGFEGC